MDLVKGKEIFFKYNGSHIYIDRECGVEYRKCNIPKEVELEWLREVKIGLLNLIDKQTGNSRIQTINSYVQLLKVPEAIAFLILVIKEYSLDTFSYIIMLENLKKYLHHNIDNSLKEEIFIMISKFKEKLLVEEINIDNSYKELLYMKDYDFSEENIKNRIMKL